ncbi:hypothetical protein [Variovorax sp. Sphag1AA]|uniref:hypothetical protein n=1 Tax=Variovorax sp. Sphag1AA TaxID=2587027 RepID=UPI00161BE024|nr:hypothetical protein [Variovorax sp. Sphag1AA]MBB3176025.1 hypothetical protein [Variovorax sp. Sphag1AA]
MDELLARCKAEPALGRACLRVLVSDQWAPGATIPWDGSQYRHSTALAAGRAQFAEAGHDVSGSDLIRLDDAPLRQPRLAVCYPLALMEFIERLAAALSTSPSSVITLSALAWRGRSVSKLPTSERLIAIVEPGEEALRTTVLLRGQQASEYIDEVMVRSIRVDSSQRPALTAAAIDAIVQRLGWQPAPSSSMEGKVEYVVIDLAAGERVSGPTGPFAWWLSQRGVHSAHSTGALDAVTRAARPSAAKLGLLLGTIASVGLLFTALWRTEQRLQSVQDRITAQRQAASVPVKPPPTPEQAKRIVAINGVISALNTPLPRLLRALQAPKDQRVALLGLELVAGSSTGATARPTLKVHAEAPNSIDMTRYVTFLSDRKPLTRAYLIRHEVPESRSPNSEGQAAYRFTVEVAWND